MPERRTQTRLPLKLFVDHILSEQEQCVCVTEDLSLDGMQLKRLPGQSWGNPRHVWLQFELPDGLGGPIRALGELCHDQASGADEALRGFRFKYLNPRAKRRYAAFVQALAA